MHLSYVLFSFHVNSIINCLNSLSFLQFFTNNALVTDVHSFAFIIHQMTYKYLLSKSLLPLKETLSSRYSSTYFSITPASAFPSFIQKVNVKTKALSHTRIVFSVHDRDRLRGDPLLGLVLMGLGATEDSVIEHWDETMVGNGRRVCRWHYIMEKGEAQDG